MFLMRLIPKVHYYILQNVMGKYTRDAACEQLEREARDKLMAVQSTQFLFQKFMCKVSTQT